MVVSMCVGPYLKEYYVIGASHDDVSVMWIVVYDTSNVSIVGI